MLESIKTVLGIKDHEQDEVLGIIIDNVQNHLKALLGAEIPASLNFIITEVAAKRYNRLGSEGMQSESVEGHSVTFQDASTDFLPYEAIIESNKAETGIKGRGVVKFL
jgi:predicted amidohydrolase YtcJ